MKTAIVRHVDSLGRIVIPSEIRSTMKIKPGDLLGIEIDGPNIQLYKYSPYEPNDKEIKAILNILYEVVPCGALVCTDDMVLGTKGICISTSSPIPELLAEYVRKGEEIIFPISSYINIFPQVKEPMAALFPIKSSDSGVSNLALVIFPHKGRAFTSMELGSAKLVAAALSHHLKKE